MDSLTSVIFLICQKPVHWSLTNYAHGNHVLNCILKQKPLYVIEWSHHFLFKLVISPFYVIIKAAVS